MHTQATALETHELLWNNYFTLVGEVDREAISREQLDVLEKLGTTTRELDLMEWLARQGYFISTWALWEYYARGFCKRLALKVDQEDKESTVRWIERWLAKNGVEFREADWFSGANNIRNLIVHSGLRVWDRRSRSQFRRAKDVLPDLLLTKDDYVLLDHEHVCLLYDRSKDFLERTS